LKKDIKDNVPLEWIQVAEGVVLQGGTILVLGASDVGKSTFSLLLLQTAYRFQKKALFIDSDPGQSSLGPPCMIDLATAPHFPEDFLSLKIISSMFVGNVSPAGVLLPLLGGLKKLHEEATALRPDLIVVDTTSLIYGQIGFELKFHKIMLLSPQIIVGIERLNEIEHLLLPWEGRGSPKIVRIPASRFAIRRSLEERRENRERMFSEYFHQARKLRVPLKMVLPASYQRFLENRLVGLYATDGKCLGMGIIISCDTQNGFVELLTPFKGDEKPHLIRPGRIRLDFNRSC
jgi:polynucleotide 5'-hydroxyl-kinase GRC3/NOL9